MLYCRKEGRKEGKKEGRKERRKEGRQSCYKNSAAQRNHVIYRVII